jgi:hypothetical protein
MFRSRQQDSIQDKVSNTALPQLVEAIELPTDADVMDQVFGGWQINGLDPHADTPAATDSLEPTELMPEQARVCLAGILEAIRDDRHGQALQSVLTGLAGRSFETYEENLAIVRQVNAVARALDVGLRMRASGESVRIRCVNPPRSKHGSIQARSADRDQRALFTGDSFPDLVIG